MKNCHPCFGAYAQRRIDQWGRRLFFLVYGAEAILPTDIIHASTRVQAYDIADAEIARQDAVDLLEEE